MVRENRNVEDKAEEWGVAPVSVLVGFAVEI
jgi:hypothetical protein